MQSRFTRNPLTAPLAYNWSKFWSHLLEMPTPNRQHLRLSLLLFVSFLGGVKKWEKMIFLNFNCCEPQLYNIYIIVTYHLSKMFGWIMFYGGWLEKLLRCLPDTPKIYLANGTLQSFTKSLIKTTFLFTSCLYELSDQWYLM